MSKRDLIYLAATLKVELIQINTPNANTNIESWIRFFSKESVKELKTTIEYLKKKLGYEVIIY